MANEPLAELLVRADAFENGDAVVIHAEPGFHEHFELRKSFVQPQVFEQFISAIKIVRAVLIFGEFFYERRIDEYRPRIVIAVVRPANAVLVPTPFFLYAFVMPADTEKALRELKRKQHYHLFRKSTGTRKIIAYMSRKTYKNAKKPSRSVRPTRLYNKAYSYFQQ